MAVGCGALIGLDDYETIHEPPGGGGQASAGGSGGSGGVGAGPCSHASFPAQPASGDGGDLDVTVALRWLDVGEERESAALPGLDLDRMCTCQGEGPSCQGVEEICDAAGGRDNALATIFVQLATLGFSSTTLSERAEAGKWTLLLRLQGYNGAADDRTVEVSWYVGSFSGYHNAVGGGGGSAGGGGAGGGVPSVPAWDGLDAWPVAATSLEAPDGGNPDLNQPKFVDDAAYVADHVLVTSFSSRQLSLGGSPPWLEIELTGGSVVATLEEGQSGWRVSEGIIVGLVTTQHAFEALASYRLNDKGVCTDELTYEVLKEILCGSVDLREETTIPTAPCDAISVGIAFGADPGLLGPIFTPEPLVDSGCDPQDDPAQDSCPQQ